ncbi:MAG: TauD/TfdA family dioxygenase [Betaproteobacteria bacterium]|jgi:taurine dioxygenase
MTTLTSSHFEIKPSAQTLGAQILGLDLSKALSHDCIEALMRALGTHGVLSFPKQTLSARELATFSARFGELEINVANNYQEPGIPEVMILSNMLDNGKPLGIADAGQDWHTDMSYSKMIAFANVLYGIKIPFRDGVSLGNTVFCNMHQAYEELPKPLKEKINGATATHDFSKFWDKMRMEKGSPRPPLSPAQKLAKPPVSHPLTMLHPITRRRVLYANPGYAMSIDGMQAQESQEILDRLFEHQLQKHLQYKHHWQEGDVLMWDNFGTIHNAVADYLPHEHRFIKRCQVMATRFFNDDGSPKAFPPAWAA